MAYVTGLQFLTHKGYFYVQFGN